MNLRSGLIILAVFAAPALAQSRAVDEGTFTVTKGGAHSFTESFKITRRDDGVLTATGRHVAGSQQTTSSLMSDSLGTPLRYESQVTDRGAKVFSVTAEARAGRLTSLSSTQAGDESMREYPMTPGRSLILESGLVHQLYFVTLVKRPTSFQIIEPRASHSVTVTVSASGLEPIEVGGKSVTGTHYTLSGGGVRYEFWIDAHGRLLRVEAPAQGIVATREEAPR